MEALAPVGPVYQAGTLSGNPLATAAGLAVLQELDEQDAYARIAKTAARLADGLSTLSGVQAPRINTLVGVFFTERSVRTYEEAKTAADNGVYPKVFTGLLDRGIRI